jgi:RNA recognition motif-containing protein
MAEKEEGAKAIEELDNQDFQGRNLKVNEARPRRQEGRRDNQSRRW